MKKLITILTISLLLSSCDKEGLKTEQSNNLEFQVTLLFEYDSIKVYRFYDGGYRHYFAKGYTETQQSCGKNCIRNEKIETK